MLFGLLSLNQDILSQNWNSQHFSKPSSLTNNLYQFKLICKQIIYVVVTNVKHRLEAEARGSEGNIFFSWWAHLCPKLTGAWAKSMKLWDFHFHDNKWVYIYVVKFLRCGLLSAARARLPDKNVRKSSLDQDWCHKIKAITITNLDFTNGFISTLTDTF